MIGIFGLIALIWSTADDLVTTLQALQGPETWRALARQEPVECGRVPDVSAASRGPPWRGVCVG